MEVNWKPQPDWAIWSSIDAAAPGDWRTQLQPEDWRTQLQPEARQRIVNKIMETLKRHLPVSAPEGLNELRKISIRFEEKIYTAATSQSEYLQKISLKMLSMEKRTLQSAPINPAMPNAGAMNQNPADPGFPISNQATVSCLTSPNKRPMIPANGSIINCESSLISGHDSSSKRTKLSDPVLEKESADEPTFSCHICMGGSEKRKEPTFSCPICMCVLASPFSTTCGHIFCEVCIKAAIQRRKECPTCRTKLTGRNSIHKVYLPTAD